MSVILACRGSPRSEARRALPRQNRRWPRLAQRSFLQRTMANMAVVAATPNASGQHGPGRDAPAPSANAALRRVYRELTARPPQFLELFSSAPPGIRFQPGRRLSCCLRLPRGRKYLNEKIALSGPSIAIVAIASIVVWLSTFSGWVEAVDALVGVVPSVV